MSDQLEFDYYYGAESEQFSFLMMPRFLIREKKFRGLSDGSKILYSQMLERMGMSRKKNWFDEENRPYIYYSIEEAMEGSGKSKPTVIKAMKELETIGLIERKKRGQGKATIIYVKKFTSEGEPSKPAKEPEVKDVDFKKSRPFTSESKEAEPQEVKNLDFKKESPLTSRGKTSELQEVKEVAPSYIDNSYTENNQTELSHIDQSYTEVSQNSPVMSSQAPDVDNSDDDDEWMDHVDWSRPIKVTMAQPVQADMTGQDKTDKELYIEMLRDQVWYEQLKQEKPFCFHMDSIDGILDIIASIATTKPKSGYERVNGRDYPHEVVKSRLLKMDYETIKYVLDRIWKGGKEIKCMRSYLISALYNAKDEMGLVIDDQVKWDMRRPYSDGGALAGGYT